MVTATRVAALRRFALVFLAFSVIAIGGFRHHAYAASEDASPRDIPGSSQVNDPVVVKA